MGFTRRDFFKPTYFPMKRITNFLSLCLLLIAFSPALQAQYSGNEEAISVRGAFPNYQFQFDNDLALSDFSPGVQIEYAKHLNDALNLAFPMTFASAKYPVDGNANIIDESLYIGLDALLQLKLFKAGQIFNPSIYAGLGTNFENLDQFNLSLPLGVQLDTRLTNWLYLSPKIEYRVGFEDDRDNLMPALGLKILLGDGDGLPVKRNDQDGDGIPDDEDLCPSIAGVLALNGCPDQDQDGIADGEDQCPTEAGPKATNGCPDNDGDGIANAQDQCPDEAGPAATNGCPDNDGDGIANAQDQCPDEAGSAATAGCPDNDGDGIANAQDECPDVAGIAAFAGCPDQDGDGIADKNDDCPTVAGSKATNGCPDDDNDGVANADDKCPNSAGTIANNGCPELTVEDKETLDFAAQNIQFETASANLKAVSLPILTQIADILRRYPDFRLSIDGHTDSIGSSANNQSLSERRAKSCFDYLVNQGISGARMQHQGFGESIPKADNKTRAGREMNRRVEFNIIQN